MGVAYLFIDLYKTVASIVVPRAYNIDFGNNVFCWLAVSVAVTDLE